MHHLAAGIFGNNDIIKRLGKQGTINDLLIYNHASSEGVYTYVSPASTEKIQPLLQAINMSDVPVIAVDELTREIAEQIIFLDAFSFDAGFIVSQNETLKEMIKGTSIERYEWVDEKELKEKLKTVKPKFGSETWAPVDNYFNVKSVGNVVLTLVKGGQVKKHDKLMMQPLGREVLLKGIQSQDKDIDLATEGMRAGLNLKGVEADEIRRGYVICKDALVSKSITIEFTKSKFAKDTADTGSQIFVSCGVQVIPGRVESVKPMTISLEHPLVYQKGQKCIIASTKQVMPRIIGSGAIR